MFIFKVKKFNT